MALRRFNELIDLGDGRADGEDMRRSQPVEHELRFAGLEQPQ